MNKYLRKQSTSYFSMSVENFYSNLYFSFVQRDLCSFWIMRSYWPPYLLKRNLKKEMIVIHKDDVALAREGIEILNEDQLKEVSDRVLVLVLDQFQGRVCMWGGGDSSEMV